MPGKFVFRFAPLLELRERVEHEKRCAFAAVRRERDEHRRAIELLGERHRACASDLHEVSQGRAVWASALCDAHLQHLGRAIETHERRLAGLSPALQLAGEELAVANRRRRIVDKLKERRRAEFERDGERREQLELDEANARTCPERAQRAEG